jgi:hypothetical protein
LLVLAALLVLVFAPLLASAISSDKPCHLARSKTGAVWWRRWEGMQGEWRGLAVERTRGACGGEMWSVETGGKNKSPGPPANFSPAFVVSLLRSTCPLNSMQM